MLACCKWAIGSTFVVFIHSSLILIAAQSNLSLDAKPALMQLESGFRGCQYFTHIDTSNQLSRNASDSDCQNWCREIVDESHTPAACHLCGARFGADYETGVKMFETITRELGLFGCKYFRLEGANASKDPEYLPESHTEKSLEAPAQPACGLYYERDIAYWSPTFVSLPASSPEECQRLSQLDPDANFFTYDEWNLECLLRQSNEIRYRVVGTVSGPALCDSTETILQPTPSPLLESVTTSTDTPLPDCFEKNIAYWNFDVASYAAGSAEECQQLSLKHGVAKFFTYDKWNAACYLKTSKVDPFRVIEVVSGPASCTNESGTTGEIPPFNTTATTTTMTTIQTTTISKDIEKNEDMGSVVPAVGGAAFGAAMLGGGYYAFSAASP